MQAIEKVEDPDAITSDRGVDEATAAEPATALDEGPAPVAPTSDADGDSAPLPAKDEADDDAEGDGNDVERVTWLGSKTHSWHWLDRLPRLRMNDKQTICVGT